MPWTVIFAYTTGGTKKFQPMTPWMPAEAVKRARGTFEVIGAQPNMSATFSYQTANVENQPDFPVFEIGAGQTIDGYSFGTMTDVSANTNSKQLVRFGLNCVNTSGAVLIVARAGGYVDISGEL
jgi:hypothetical protein